MTEPHEITPQTTRERALETIDHIRDALTKDNLQSALDHIGILQSTLASWTRRDIRNWLDKALRGDLLTFDVQSAKTRLQQWQTAAPEDERDHDYYSERIDERGQQKQVELQVRGAIAHCEALWSEADQLEQSAQPPKPDFVMANYYQRALDIVKSTASEHPTNASLSSLVQKAETTLSHKQVANRAYQSAIEGENYAEVLAELDTLPDTLLIPHYRILTNEDPARTDTEFTRFDAMITRTEAQDELTRYARIWGQTTAESIIATVEEALAQYQPQRALDELKDGIKIQEFVEKDLQDTIIALDARARDNLQRLEQAERRARHAQRLAEENPIGAWDVYAESYHTYPGAPGLNVARKEIVKQLAGQLERVVLEAEKAYTGHDYDRFEQLHRSILQNYADKDTQLDELIARLNEMHIDVQTFREKSQNARRLLEQIRQVKTEDLKRAGDLLTQLEHLPADVLHTLADYQHIRDEVRAGLNVEIVFNQLVNLLTSQDVAEIERGIDTTREYHAESRFEALRLDLQLHRDFLQARQHYANGNIDDALKLLDRVIAIEGHPDRESAQALIEDIRGDAEANT